VTQVVKRMKELGNRVGVKVPPNFDFKDFEDVVGPYRTYQVKNPSGSVSYHLLFV